ncbi:MAG TPA: hypothetical protein VK879_10430 [Candidatus Sulfomarinibacteraceae bacterium]|nr:hypothetical protein [Candidatus Sulfomarinibacteraceae bacterium]
MQRTPSGRYEIHELMRQYGAAKLLERPEEETETRDRHARYYLAYLLQQEAPIRGPEQSRVLAQAADEVENVKMAWNWAITRHRLDWLGRMLPAWLWLFEIRNDFQDVAAHPQANEAAREAARRVSDGVNGEGEAAAPFDGGSFGDVVRVVLAQRQ